MNVMIKRMLEWMIAIVISYSAGIYIDYFIYRINTPIYIRVIGLLGVILSFRLLQLSGEYLRRLGNPERWGLTTKLVTEGLYSCVRHPHHLGIGLMVSSLSLLIGGPMTFIIASIAIWILIYWFLNAVEESELLEKFGDEYLKYRERVPKLIPNISCIFWELIKGSG